MNKQNDKFFCKKCGQHKFEVNEVPELSCQCAGGEHFKNGGENFKNDEEMIQEAHRLSQHQD